MKLTHIKHAFILTAIVLALMVSPASALQFGFDNITNNNAGDAAIGESQLFFNVTDQGAGQALFTFGNTGPEASSIVQIYFDDAASVLNGIAAIDDSAPGVSFSEGAAPPDLPGGNTIAFNSDYSADADSKGDDDSTGKQLNGVNPGESVGITFDITTDFDDLITAITDGNLRVGIHVQGFESGGSESFVNTQTPIPEPATFALLGLGLIALAGFRRRIIK